jgi:DNA invertase Pin-like site-specific DNA recombinase
MNAIGYLRVSTDEQAERKNGLEAQEDAIRAKCKRDSVEVVGLFMDPGIGGTTSLGKRPGLMAAVDSLERGDVLVVAKRDRLGRDPLVVAMIEAAVEHKGAKVMSAAGEGTDGNEPGDVLMRRMVDAFAEYERLILRARTKAALRAKSDRGEQIGRPPFGWKPDAKELAARKAAVARREKSPPAVHLVESAREQAVLHEIESMRREGATWREIAREIGPHPRTGKPWSHSQLLRLTRLGPTEKEWEDLS